MLRKSGPPVAWTVAGLVCLVVLILAAGLAALGTAAMGRRPRNNPKLSTQLTVLARAVPQRKTPLAPGERVAPPKGFSIEKLPKSIRDAIRAGMMRVNKNAEVQVYIEVSKLTSQSLQELRSAGVVVQIVSGPGATPGKTSRLDGVPMVFSGTPIVQGEVPASRLEAVADLPFVKFVGLPSYGISQTGSVDTQGDSILQADLARQQFGVDGTGIKVGVISGGIGGIFATGCTTCGPTTATPSPITLGDLPNATGTRNATGVLTSVSGGITAQSFRSDSNLEPPASDTSSGAAAEGTAMLEIVHDLAPGAQLFFANSDTSLAFEQAVNFLAGNADVVVDDISFCAAPPGGSPNSSVGLYDGLDSVSANTAAALNINTNAIRAYFTSVGNFAQDHYEEQYVDSGVDGTSITGESGHLHLFQAVPNLTTDNQGFGPSIADPTAVLGVSTTVPAGGKLLVSLVWNDPFGASTNDYDLFLVPLSCSGFSPSNGLPLPPCSISGPPVGMSTDSQTGTHDPVEVAGYINSTSSAQAIGIVIQNVGNLAAVRTFDMFVLGTLADRPSPDHNFNTVAGSVPAESDAGGSPVSVISVGAANQADFQPGFSGPITVEPFSSQGPTESTPQAASRTKPDVTAVDGVCVTGAGGFGNGPATNCPPTQPTSYTPQTFPGTSAAAPHVAAIAALVLQAAPCLLSSSTINTPATARTNLRNFITSTAVPLPGVSQAVPNNIEGFGLVDALAAATATVPRANAGANQTVNGTSASGASVTLSGSGVDPDSCPLTFSWSGSCGSASGANPSVTCPIGTDTEKLTVSNGGVKSSLPTSTVQITVSDFSVASTQASATVSPGQSASYTINVGSNFGAFTNPVSLACSGLPSLSSCAFSPASVTPGSGTATSTLTISTTASSSVFPLFGPGSPSTPLLTLWLGLLLTVAVVAIFAGKSGRKFGFGLASCALLLCLTVAIASCGGGGAPRSPGTPGGTYTITVTGTSNALQHSEPVTLVVR